VKERFITLKNKLKFRKKEQASATSSAAKRGGKSIILLMALVLILIAAGGAGLRITSSNSFCISCHEMEPEHLTYQVTSHSKYSCTTCHVAPGIGNYVQGKFRVIGYIAKYFTNKYTLPIVSSTAIPNQVCENCHSSIRKVTPSGDINVTHENHLQQGIACINCHGGVAHALVAERGLTTKENIATWTLAKAEQVSKFDDTKTAMEACLDCHEQVNLGEKPWLDAEIPAKEGTDKLPQAVEALASSATSEVTAPTRCAACHKTIVTPVNHVEKTWGDTHGITAAKDVSYCASCHSRQKDRALVTAQTNVKDYSRSNTFCATCHLERPVGHLANQHQWLPAHSIVVKDKGAQNCLVCHEITQATDQNKNKIPGVNAVTCNTCHWFKNGKVE